MFKQRRKKSPGGRERYETRRKGKEGYRTEREVKGIKKSRFCIDRKEGNH